MDDGEGDDERGTFTVSCSSMHIQHIQHTRFLKSGPLNAWRSFLRFGVQRARYCVAF